MASKQVVIITHTYCLDGFAAAWVAYQRYKYRASYHGIHPNSGISELPKIKNKIVYIFDVSVNKETLDYIRKNCKKFILIDHHISGYREIGNEDCTYFDMNHSACFLVWKYFFPKRKTPPFIKYIEDNDIGAWKIPLTREFITAVHVKYPLELTLENLKIWNALQKPVIIKKLINMGKRYLEMIEYIVNSNIHKAHDKYVGFYKVKLINLNIGKPISDAIANKLANKSNVDFAAVWTYIERKKSFRVIMRSVNKKIDLSKIARHFSADGKGGGHPGAAAFHTDNLETIFTDKPSKIKITNLKII